MKKIFLSIMFVFVGLIFISCGGGAKSSANKDLEYWTFFTGGDGEFMRELVNKYNEENPDNKVNMIIVDWGTYYTKLSTAYLGNTLPDIGVAHLHMLSSILTYGDLTAIDEIDPSFDCAQFPQQTVDNITIDGKHLAVPFDTHGWIMYYNPDLVKGTSLVDANGNWICNSWEGLEKGLAEIKALHPDVMPISINNPDTAFQWTWYSLYKQAGGEKFLDANGLLELDEEPAKKSLDALKSIFDKGFASKGHNSTLDFMKEKKAAIAFEGVWTYGAMKAAVPNMKATRMPNFFGKDVAWGTGHAFIFPKGNNVDPERQKKALKFAQYLVDNGVLWSQAGHIPAKIAVQESEEYKNSPNSVYKDLAVNLAPWPKSQYIDIAIGGQISIVANYIDQYLNGSITTIKDLVSKINTEIEAKK